MTRARSAGLLLLVGLALSGCGTFENNDDAAAVGDTDITVDEYEEVLEALTVDSDVTGLVEDTVTDTVTGDDGRQVLTIVVVDVANDEFLAAAGESITDADRQAILDTVDPDDPSLELADDVVQLLVDRQAGATARARIPAPDAAELERRYEESPASLGVMCVRHVLLETEAEAQAVVDELADGADIETLAAERSTEPAAADTGGAITAADGSACLPLTQARQQLDPAFVAAAVEARPGAPAGPVGTQFGWHVIVARPYDEVADSLAALYEQAAGELMFAGYLATADIQVDPRYGRWDRPTGSVVAL